MKKHVISIAVFLTAVVVSSCSLSSSSIQLSIQENPWGLITINQGNLLEGTQITLKFEGNQVTGSAGCNVYTGSYDVSRNIIAIGPIVQTEMDCADIPGIMDQERLYLEILGVAHSFELEDGVLTIVSEKGERLAYQPFPPSLSGQDLPLDEQPSVSQTIPTDEPEPTQTAESIEPPAGFKEYQDSQTRISIHIPEEWYIDTQNIVEGDYAIFSSYPPDKYVGGERRQPGDTKCDLNLNPDIDSVDDLIQLWESSPMTNIVSEEEFVLNSGISGVKFVIDSMGRSTTMVTKLNRSLVTFTCWGEFELFDEIAVTLHAAGESLP